VWLATRRKGSLRDNVAGRAGGGGEAAADSAVAARFDLKILAFGHSGRPKRGEEALGIMAAGY
jgi:hypothetical protein